MITHIERTRAELLKVLHSRRENWKALSNDELKAIVHECERVRNSQEWTERTGAEINLAAAVLILEKRGVI